MPDDLYDRDVLSWSEQQAELPRRLSRAECVNGIDRENVIDEIECVGRSQSHDVHEFLSRILLGLLTLQLSPERDAHRQAREEIAMAQAEADMRFTPSMRSRIDLVKLHCQALAVVHELMARKALVPPLPDRCPVTLDQLLNASVDDLQAAFTAATQAAD